LDASNRQACGSRSGKSFAEVRAYCRTTLVVRGKSATGAFVALKTTFTQHSHNMKMGKDRMAKF
jgi:hypothetical protein